MTQISTHINIITLTSSCQVVYVSIVAWDDGTTGKVGPLLTLAVTAAPLLWYYTSKPCFHKYYIVSPHRDPSKNHTSGLRLYGNLTTHNNHFIIRIHISIAPSTNMSNNWSFTNDTTSSNTHDDHPHTTHPNNFRTGIVRWTAKQNSNPQSNRIWVLTHNWSLTYGPVLGGKPYQNQLL